jgi:hypothetical protein
MHRSVGVFGTLSSFEVTMESSTLSSEATIPRILAVAGLGQKEKSNREKLMIDYLSAQK